MTKSSIIPALAGAALMLAHVAGAQAQHRTVIRQQPTVLPSTGFAVKNGGAFANQGGIAAQAGVGRANGLIGMDHATKPGIMSRDSAGMMNRNGFR